MFREPGLTAASIVRECAEIPCLASVRMDHARGFAIWTAIYRSLLALRDLPLDIAFVHCK